jgi:hypothetical protein
MNFTGQAPRSAKLFCKHSQVTFVPYRIVLKDDIEHPPAMHHKRWWYDHCHRAEAQGHSTKTTQRHCGQVERPTLNSPQASKHLSASGGSNNDVAPLRNLISFVFKNPMSNLE